MKQRIKRKKQDYPSDARVAARFLCLGGLSLRASRGREGLGEPMRARAFCLTSLEARRGLGFGSLRILEG